MIILMAIFWYGLIPIAGAFAERHRWRVFRRRFGELRTRPFLDYTALVQSGDRAEEYRFCGALESVGSNGILWIRSGDLTVQADLRGVRIYVFPNIGEENPLISDPGVEVPERIRWDRIPALTGEAKVFIGGALDKRENRRMFASLPEKPLLVIFYEGSERALAIKTVRAGRHRNEFFNFLTPYAFILGAFSQLLIALSLLSRPALRLNMIFAFIALFAPLIAWIPPGILFTLVYRRLWWRARIYRSYRDLARFPLDYLAGGETSGLLPDGEVYVLRQYDALPPEYYKKKPPFFIPAGEKRMKDKWLVFGSLREPEEDGFPAEPKDSFAVSGVLPGDPESLARRYTRKAYGLEIISWLFLLAGMGINVFFISLILSLLRL